MHSILQLVVNGLIHGSILMLAALGLTLVFRISGFANIAHAELITLGAYLAFFFSGTLAMKQAVALPLGATATAIVALLIYRLVFAPLGRRSPVTLVIASIGIGLFLQNLVIFIWGTDQLPYPVPAQRGLSILGVRVTPVELWIIGGALVLMVLVHLLLTQTRLGKEMRAVADSQDLARIVGIRPERVVMAMWIIAGGLAAVAGALVAMKTVVSPYLGWHLLLSAFAATILGGIGNPYGAMVGAVVMGIAEEISTLLITPAYRPAIAFAVMTAFLLFRPSGIFGESAGK
ncbi:MAG: branched-chain amino acid ABC transporter permease [Bacillota bacterium]